MAKNRVRQRENRRHKEDRIELRDFCGMKDPTPFEAVKNMVRRGESAADFRKVRVTV